MTSQQSDVFNPQIVLVSSCFGALLCAIDSLIRFHLSDCSCHNFASLIYEHWSPSITCEYPEEWKNRKWEKRLTKRTNKDKNIAAEKLAISSLTNVLRTVISGMGKRARESNEGSSPRPGHSWFKLTPNNYYFSQAWKGCMACQNTSWGLRSKRWCLGRVVDTRWQWGCFIVSPQFQPCLLMNYCSRALLEMCSPDDSW